MTANKEFFEDGLIELSLECSTHCLTQNSIFPNSANILFGVRRGEQIFSQGSNIFPNKTNSTNLYPPMKGYFRETCKSQNINPIYLTLSSPSVSFRS